MLSTNNSPPSSQEISEFEQSIQSWVDQWHIQLPEREGRKIALNRIVQAYKNQEEHLNLFGLKLTSLPPEIVNLTNLKVLNLGNNKLEKLPPQFDNLKQLKAIYFHANKLSQIPQEICQLNSLETLTFSNNEITSIPAEIGNLTLLKNLNLSYNQLTALPDGINNLSSLEILDLRENTKLPNNLGLITMLNDLEESHPNLTINWPIHLDRNSVATSLKKMVSDAYKKYYSHDPNFAGIEPNQSDIAKYPTLALIHRFMSESVMARGRISEITKTILPVAQKIRDNPELLEFIDPISSNYLENCINQPVAGFTEIANLLDIIEAPNIEKKLEKFRVIMAVHLIRSEALKLNPGYAIEVELGNAMLREVHQKLLSNNDITEPWSGIPNDLTYERTITPYLTQENIENITNKVKAELQKPLTEVAKIACDGVMQNSWPELVLNKHDLTQISEPFLKQKTKIAQLNIGDANYEEESQLLKKLEYEYRCNIFEKARIETFRGIEGGIEVGSSPSPSNSQQLTSSLGIPSKR